jgi:hypothetical protein
MPYAISTMFLIKAFRPSHAHTERSHSFLKHINAFIVAAEKAKHAASD